MENHKTFGVPNIAESEQDRILNSFLEKRDMLGVLHYVEGLLSNLLQSRNRWNSLFVDYHEPFVERVWTQLGQVRVYLHKIHTCKPDEALFHPHPWPSAMRVISGNYEMGVGYGAGERTPPVATRLILGPGSEYEMTDPDSWHYVRPIKRSTVSVMVAGKPWGRVLPKSDKVLRPLDEKQKATILNFMSDHYRRKKE